MRYACKILFGVAHSCVWNLVAAPHGSPVLCRAAASDSPDQFSPTSNASCLPSLLGEKERQRNRYTVDEHCCKNDVYIYNSWAWNQHIGMISEGSRDTKDWSNENSDLLSQE